MDHMREAAASWRALAPADKVARQAAAARAKEAWAAAHARAA